MRKILLLLVLVFLLPRQAHAQILVIDVLAEIQHGLQVAIKETALVVHQLQNEALFIMNRRLNSWSPVIKFFVGEEETPIWRIFDWFSEDPNVAFVRIFHQALSYGDPSGAAYTEIAMPRLPPDVPAAQREAMRARLATLDLSDAVVTRSASALGTLRFAGRDQAESIQTLQALVLEDDDSQGMNAVVSKLTAQTLIDARAKQADLTRQTALVELMAVDAKRQHDAAVDYLNSQLRLQEDAGELWRQSTAGSGAILAGWYPR